MSGATCHITLLIYISESICNRYWLRGAFLDLKRDLIIFKEQETYFKPKMFILFCKKVNYELNVYLQFW